MCPSPVLERGQAAAPLAHTTAGGAKRTTGGNMAGSAKGCLRWEPCKGGLCNEGAGNRELQMGALQKTLMQMRLCKKGVCKRGVWN